MSTFAFGKADRIMLMSEVRLFANNSTPVYHAVVGDVFGFDNVMRVLNKLGPGAINISPEAISGWAFAAQEHWMPEIWPLPFWRQAA